MGKGIAEGAEAAVTIADSKATADSKTKTETEIAKNSTTKEATGAEIGTKKNRTREGKQGRSIQKNY